MPDNTIAESIYEQWQSGLARLQSALPNDFETLTSSSVLFNGDKFAFSTSTKVLQGEIIDYHLGVQSAKRKVFQWLQHLVTSAGSDSPVQSQVYYIDWNQSNGESNGAIKRVTYSAVEPDDAKAQLLVWEQALQESLVRPSFYHAKLGEALARATQPESVWHTHMNGNMQLPGILNDPYFAWMCDTPPALEDWLDKLVALYQPMVANSKDAKVKSELLKNENGDV
jgi:hypothetical protein